MMAESVWAQLPIPLRIVNRNPTVEEASSGGKPAVPDTNYFFPHYSDDRHRSSYDQLVGQEFWADVMVDTVISSTYKVASCSVRVAWNLAVIRLQEVRIGDMWGFGVDSGLTFQVNSQTVSQDSFLLDPLVSQNSRAVEVELTTPSSVGPDGESSLFKLRFQVAAPGVSPIDITAAEVKDQYGVPFTLYYITSSGSNGWAKFILGDFGGDHNDWIPDSEVDYRDLVPLAVNFGRSIGDTALTLPDDSVFWRGRLDIGPTSTGGVDGIPQQDGRIDFEDLVLFSINYGRSYQGTFDQKGIPHPNPQVTVRWRGWPEEAPGDSFTCDLVVENIASLKAFRVVLEYDSRALALGSVDEGRWLKDERRVFFHSSRKTEGGVGILDLSAALLEGTASGDGELVRFCFHSRPGQIFSPPRVVLDLRDGINRRISYRWTYGTGETLAGEFRLGSNYPNPFNANTAIPFVIDQEGSVSLSVVNSKGQVISPLFNGLRQPGIYQVIWDATDGDGLKVASGPYFILLEQGPRRAVRRVLILR
ncbi:hypothetical protein ISS37_02645 [candidate division KSB1 bacterium]|nr:hypothetical protein [candidate division KSB1 bacterium]